MMSSAINLKNWCFHLVNLFVNEEKLFYHLKDLLDELSKMKPSIPSDLGVVLDHLTRKEFLTNENPSILTLLAMIFSQLHRYIHLVEYSSQENLQKIMHLLNKALICFEERFSKKLLEELIDSHILNLCHQFTDENTRVEWIVNILSTCIDCTNKTTGSDTKDLIFKLLKHFLEKMRRKHVHIRILDKLYGYIIKTPSNTHEVEMVSKLLNACYARLEMKTKEFLLNYLTTGIGQEGLSMSYKELYLIKKLHQVCPEMVVGILNNIEYCFSNNRRDKMSAIRLMVYLFSYPGSKIAIDYRKLWLKFISVISSGEEERKIGIWFTCNFLQSHPSMRGECLDYLKRRTNDYEVEVVLMVIDGLHRAVCFDPTVFSDDTQPLNLIAELALHHEEFNVRQRAIKTLAHVHHKYKHEENIASSKKILVWIRNTILKHCISRPANRDRSVVDNMWTMYLVNPRLSPEKRMDTLLQIWVSLDEDAQAGYHKLASHHIEMRSLLRQLLENLRKPECNPEDESTVENLVHLISDQLEEQENDIQHVEKIVHLLEEDQSLQELIEQLLHSGIMCYHSETIYEVFFEYPHLGFCQQVLRFLTMLVKSNTCVMEVLKIICLLSKHTHLESLFGIQFNEILVSKLKFILVNGPIEQAKYAAEFFARHLTNREDGIFQLVNEVLQVYMQILKKPIKLAFMDQNLLSSVVVGHFAKLVLPHHYETLDSLIDISIKQVHCIKALSHYMFTRVEDQENISKLFAIAKKFLDNKGDYSLCKNYSPASMALLRLTMGKAVLNLCTKHIFWTHMPPSMFVSLASLVTDIEPVSQRFCTHLVKRLITAPNLPTDFISLFAVGGALGRARAIRSDLVTVVNKRRKHYKHLLLVDNGIELFTPLLDYDINGLLENHQHEAVEHCLNSAVFLLAHHPHFKSVNEVKGLRTVKTCLKFLMSTFVEGQVKLSPDFYGRLFAEIKLRYNADCSEDRLVNKKVWVICELGELILPSLCRSKKNCKDPENVLVSQKFYSVERLESNHMYLPPRLYRQLGWVHKAAELLGPHFESSDEEELPPLGKNMSLKSKMIIPRLALIKRKSVQFDQSDNIVTYSADWVVKLILHLFSIQRDFVLVIILPLCRRWEHQVVQSLYSKMAGIVEEIEDEHLKHLFDSKDVINVYNLDVVNLSAGAPGPDLLKRCIPLFMQATVHRMEKEQEHAYLFQYGITSGLWEYREQLSQFLTKRYSEQVNRADLVLTCGAAHGLMLIIDTFLPRNAVIFVEDVTYMIALEAFRHFPSMKVVPVPQTSEGVDTEALKIIASEERSKGSWELTENKLFWAIFYTIPIFHNPTGVTMSQNCCESLVRVARKLDLAVVCDDVYNLLYYGDSASPPRRLFSYDRGTEGFRGGHVISNGTFSKIMAPGVRVGWLEVAPRLALVLRNSGILKSGGAVNQYMSGVITSILELGLEDKHLDFLVHTCKERMQAVCDTLDQFLPSYCSFMRPEGGYFVWLRLPESVDANRLAVWCQEKYKVAAIPGSRFSVKQGFKNYLRLAIAFHQKESKLLAYRFTGLIDAKVQHMQMYTKDADESLKICQLSHVIIALKMSSSSSDEFLLLERTDVQYNATWESLDSRPLPPWYDEAKIGIFLHWGVFSVPGFGSEWFWQRWRGNYSEYVEFMDKNYPPGYTYQDFARDFTAEFYNPDDWAELFQSSGAKYMVLTSKQHKGYTFCLLIDMWILFLDMGYVVLTSKHHEGYTLWPSSVSFSWNSVDVGPHRNLLGDLANSIRSKTDLKFGVYHSMFEWFNPLYMRDKSTNFSKQTFVGHKTIPELYELVNTYKPDVIWSDGDAEAPDSYWMSTDFLAWLYNESPVKSTVVVNDRWGKGVACHHGGYYTCNDRYNPGVLLKHKWENCMTLDKRSWGFRRNAKLSDYLTTAELIQELAETISCGGNILINVGPTKDGIIAPIFEERLRDLGSWLKVNGKAIYSTKSWVFQNDTVTSGVWYTKGNENDVDQKVYAIVLEWPKERQLLLGSPMLTQDSKLSILGGTGQLKWSQTSKGVLVHFPGRDLLSTDWAWVVCIEGAVN
uniref:alpha-L-fucosidase n=1 Tax=Timema bartmani TaxID=61472 RepID=A0A7R9EPI1_9NEOP|nr:unnamed protein product [Timema bartmani]